MTNKNKKISLLFTLNLANNFITYYFEHKPTAHNKRVFLQIFFHDTVRFLKTMYGVKRNSYLLYKECIVLVHNEMKLFYRRENILP